MDNKNLSKDQLRTEMRTKSYKMNYVKKTNETIIVKEKINKFIDFFNKYEKKINVDYDAVIIIASFNRYEKLCRILDQLYTQKRKYKIKIIISNDGSTDMMYNNILNKYLNIDYIHNTVNRGKEGYWKTISTLFNKASEYISHVVIQIDDDFILCDNFINRLMDYFFECKKINNKNVAIYYHRSPNAIMLWGLTNWIDGGALFDTDFLKKIDNKIDSISKERWAVEPQLGSGVWGQISEKIHFNGLLTYKLENPLAMHDGNDDSKMNSEHRKKNPIHTSGFKKD